MAPTVVSVCHYNAGSVFYPLYLKALELFSFGLETGLAYNMRAVRDSGLLGCDTASLDE